MGGHDKRRQVVWGQAADVRKEMHRLIDPVGRAIQSGDNVLSQMMQTQWRNLDVFFGHAKAADVDIESLENSAGELERMLRVIRERTETK